MNITQDWTIVYFLQGSIFPMSRMHIKSYTEQSPNPSVQMPNRCSKATPTMYQPDLWDLPLTGRTKHCHCFLIENEKNMFHPNPHLPKSSIAKNQNAPPQSLVTVLSQLLLGLVINLCALLGIGQLSSCSLLACVVCSALDLPSLLKSIKRQILSLYSSDHVTYLATTSWYFHPTSWLNLPTVQYLRPGFSLKTLKAWGTTTLLILSYGGGTPSKTLSLSIAAAPRAVLWGIMPRTVLQKILDGARKWNGPISSQNTILCFCAL